VEDRLEAVRKAPTDPRARLELAVAYAQAEEYDLAMAELVEAIKFNPENRDNLSARANYHLGLVLLAIDRAGLAVNALREALRLGWKDAAVHLALGQALTGQGKFEEAIAQYHEALRLAPSRRMRALAWRLRGPAAWMRRSPSTNCTCNQRRGPTSTASRRSRSAWRN